MLEATVRMNEGMIDRRHFLARATAFGAGFIALREGFARGGLGGALGDAGGFGPLVKDPAGLLDLPRGFSYQVLARYGDEMDDGLIVPGMQDAMAAFPRPDGTTALVVNHEVEIPAHGPIGPFGRKDERLDRIAPQALYDHGARGRGGCSTIVYDTKTRAVRRRTLTLAGTVRNCAGGTTPWNTWLTCEECFESKGDGFHEDHGYVFECAPLNDGLTVNPKPIREMGRFNHEAVAIDPASGAVYLTEDRVDGLLYRFLPRVRTDLHKGGKLQALAIRGQRRRLMQNWGKAEVIPVGAALPVEWIDVDEVDARVDDLRYRGFERGAAQFARGEGMWFGIGPGAKRDSVRPSSRVYFACTNGGSKKLGQLWRYLPSPYEGTNREREDSGVLELFLEPNDSSVIANADNLSVTPWGGLVVCEDSDLDRKRMIMVSPDGRVSTFARNALNRSELAGSCFSPDGTTMFVNIQNPGITLAIHGPWAAVAER